MRLNRHANETPVLATKIESFTGGALTVVAVRVDRNPWYVLTCSTKDAQLSVVGTFMSPPVVGQRVYVRGTWVDSDYGWQFDITGGFPLDGEKADLATKRGIEHWLTRLPEIGPKRAAEIVERFGVDVVTVLDDEPTKLLEISGITEGRLDAIKAAYVLERLDAELFMWLLGLGLSDKLIKSAVLKFSTQLRNVVEATPYQLLKVAGARWEQVDECGRQLGVPSDDPDRIGAALWCEATEVCNKNGHTALFASHVANAASVRLPGVNFMTMKAVLNDTEWVIYEDDRVSPADLFHAEADILVGVRQRTGEAFWGGGQ